MCAPTPLIPALGRQQQVGLCECSYMWEYDLFQCGAVLMGSSSPLPPADFTLLPLSVGTTCSWRGSGKCGQGKQLGTAGGVQGGQRTWETSEKGRKSFLQRRLLCGESPTSPHSLHTHTGGGEQRGRVY